MNSLANKMNVMNLLGTGLSVTTLLDRANLTMGELCELADEYPDLHNELKRWYKRYEFTAKKLNFDEPVVSLNPDTYWKVKPEIKHETVKEGDVEINSGDINSLKTKEEKPKTVRKPKKKVVEK